MHRTKLARRIGDRDELDEQLCELYRSKASSYNQVGVPVGVPRAITASGPRFDPIGQRFIDMQRKNMVRMLVFRRADRPAELPVREGVGSFEIADGDRVGFVFGLLLLVFAVGSSFCAFLTDSHSWAFAGALAMFLGGFFIYAVLSRLRTKAEQSIAMEPGEHSGPRLAYSEGV